MLGDDPSSEPGPKHCAIFVPSRWDGCNCPTRTPTTGVGAYAYNGDGYLWQVVRRTSISFSAEDLAALGHLVAAGQVMLQAHRRVPVIARLKAALTRLGVPIPAGL